MIYINDKPADTAALIKDYSENSVERAVINTLSSSDEKYVYSSLNELKFELRMRSEIVKAAHELNKSGLSFEVFRESRCNPDYWKRHNDGGFELKPDVKASDAILDIFKNGSKYGTECATAMQIVYYKALLSIFPEDAFNKMFKGIYLMNWHRVSEQLRDIGVMHREKDYLPGDRRYFANPDVDPETPEWQGENVIDMGNGLYYGHGIGIRNADAIIDALNKNRKDGAQKEAYLMDSAARPDFKKLSALFDTATASS